MPLDEAMRRDPVLVALLRSGDERATGRIIDFRDGSSRKKFIRVSEVYACDACRPLLERELAKCPSWCVAEIDRGPGPEKLTIAPNTDVLARSS